MRVCKYVVAGHYAVALADTTHTEDFDDEGGVFDEESEEAIEREEGIDDADEGYDEERWEAMDNMGTVDLLAFSIADLRTYAGKHLSIVGASKIPGGKTALIKRIMKAR
jgi:hypothetical protein